MNIPEDWPTNYMTQAGYAELPIGSHHIGYAGIRAIFNAMLAAAPTPPATQHYEEQPDGTIHALDPADTKRPDAATPPAPEISLTDGYTAQVTSIKYLAGEIMLQMFNDGEVPQDISSGDLVTLKGSVSLGGASPAPEVEPVAETDAFEEWAKSERMDMEMHPIHYLFLDSKTYAARQGWKAGMKFKQTRQDDGLRKAAEELIKMFGEFCKGDACYGSGDCVENLRAELEKKS